MDRGVEERPFATPAKSRFRILSIDGGGIRGLIPALFLARLERLLAERGGPPDLASAFDLVAGTSTGGLLALGLTIPRDGRPALGPAELVDLYSGTDAKRIFARRGLRRLPLVGRALDLLGPRYGSRQLRAVLAERLGEATIADALTEVLITAYDMHGREPRFFKRWMAGAAEVAAVDAGVATASAPTYFPAHAVGERALVDGGVFANDPTVAAIVEALKRTEGGRVSADDLLVVSLGTGHHTVGYEAKRVSRWGALGWILPKGNAPPPLIDAMLDAQSDATDHWAHMLLNHVPGNPVPAAGGLGTGPHYYRYEVALPRPVPMDTTRDRDIAYLADRAEAMLAAREPELAALADSLATPPAPRE